MSFNLLGLITKDNGNLNIELLREKLLVFFSKDSTFEIEYEEDPFDTEQQNILLKWPNWWVRVFYEQDEEVIEDSKEIASLNDELSETLCTVSSRVRVLFGDDDSKEYTNQILYMMDFLEDIPDVILFDPQKNEFID